MSCCIGSVRTLDTQGDYSQPGEPLYQRSLHPFEKAALANMFVSSGSEDPVEEAREFQTALNIFHPAGSSSS